MTLTASRPVSPPADDAHSSGGREFGPIRWLPRVLVIALLAFWVLVVIPRSETYAPFAADAVIFAIVGLSLNIIVGYTGQLSLGHQGFFGAGAFAAAYAITVQSLPFWSTFVVAAGVGALFAALLGVAALRITGLYLALITLVFGVTLQRSLFEVPEFTNGGAGQPAERPEWLFADGRFYLFCLAFLIGVVYIDYRLTQTKSGRALLALKENERVAEAFGVNVTSFKLLAFVLSGAIAGIAGALYAYRIGNVTGDDFNFTLALTFVLMVVVGGLGNRLGVILGATLFAVLDGYLLEEVGFLHSFTEQIFRTPNLAQYDAQFLGALGLLLTIVLNPGGIAQQIQPFTRWLSGKPFSLHGDSESGPAAVEGSHVRA
ncbi:MAG: amino acid/amide transporter rane protein 2, family [Frankiales bacterium]|jgi:branched-chain amino acid transport system permease protein|nr:amino acid/amide transporter rane protein 2, family [Frankiales bacterium]